MGATVLRDDLHRALDPARFMQACGWLPDPWQAAVVRSMAPRALLNCSRQSGKSSVAAVVALHQALYAPASLILLVSPSLRQSQELFRKVQAAYRALKHPVALEEESALRYEFTNGSRILSLPGNEDTIRGYSSVHLLVIDEAARVVDDLFHAVTPMLAVSGGKVMCLSTPWGRRGWWFEAWEYGAGWERTKVAASECPRIAEGFLAEQRATMPALYFQSEFECCFTDTDANVFREEDLQAMLDDTVEPWAFLGGGRHDGYGGV